MGSAVLGWGLPRSHWSSSLKARGAIPTPSQKGVIGQACPVPPPAGTQPGGEGRPGVSQLEGPVGPRGCPSSAHGMGEGCSTRRGERASPLTSRVTSTAAGRRKGRAWVRAQAGVFQDGAGVCSWVCTESAPHTSSHSLHGWWSGTSTFPPFPGAAVGPAGGRGQACAHACAPVRGCQAGVGAACCGSPALSREARLLLPPADPRAPRRGQACPLPPSRLEPFQLLKRSGFGKP